MNMMMLICGIACQGNEEEYRFCGIADPEQTPYDFTTRLLTKGYTRVAAIPLWQLPQYPLAWQQFLDHNREGAV